MASLTATFEAGTNGSTILNTDPGSANAWDTTSAAAGATRTYDNTQFAHGAQSGKYAIGATAGVNYCAWTTSWGTQTDHYGRLYIYFTALPGANATLFCSIDSGLRNAAIILRTDGKIQLQDRGGNTTNGTVALSTNTWYRIEYHVVHNTSTGSITVNVYAGDSTSTTDSVTWTSRNTGANSTQGRYGANVIGSVSNWTVYLDDIVGTAAAFPGPPFNSVTGAADLTGSGSLSASGTRTRLGAANLTGAGTLSASGVRTRFGAAALTGTGTSTGAGVRTRFGAADLTGTGSSTVAGVRTRFGAADLAGTGSMTVAGARLVLGASTLTGTGDLTAAGVVLRLGAAALTGAGSLTASGTVNAGPVMFPTGPAGEITDVLQGRIPTVTAGHYSHPTAGPATRRYP